MSLSKQQIVGIGSGCAFLLVAGLLGYMLYDAAAERAKVEVGDEETGDPGLETAKEAFMAYNRAPVFPSQGSIDAVKSNAAQYVAWYADARALAARGDYAEPAVPEDNSAFKDRLKEEVDRLAKLPGGVEGHIAGGDCRFGFEKYLGENGILPDQKDVPLLARQLASISRVVDIFAEAGVFEVQSVQRPDMKAASDDRSEKKSKGNAKGAKDAAEPSETCLEYKFAVRARPAALVKLLNGLSSDARFMVVKDFSFRKTESSDMILRNISAKESAESKSAAPASGRRGRRRALEQQPALGAGEPEKKQSRLVVDPELDDPFEVAFTLAVYDFGGKVAEEGDKNAAAPKDAGAPAGGGAADASVQQGKEAK